MHVFIFVSKEMVSGGVWKSGRTRTDALQAKMVAFLSQDFQLMQTRFIYVTIQKIYS